MGWVAYILYEGSFARHAKLQGDMENIINSVKKYRSDEEKPKERSGE
jgi:hypothetical protein